MSRDLQQRQDQNVQLKAGGSVDVDAEHNPETSRRASNAGLRREEQIHAIAAGGMQGGGSKLPHYDKIQAAFGSHDISHVQAYTGAQAEGASRAMGAEAYAQGSNVAFAGTPDLHTAAHEAAHVVQQQQGVQLKGGVGAAGDQYEQNADAVADRVVQGKSAEDLLGSPSGAKAQGNAVQHKGNDKPKDADDADIGSEVKTAAADKAAILYLAKRFHTWGPKLNDLQQGNNTDAGTAPAVDAITNIYKSAVAEVHRIKELIAVTGQKQTLASSIDQLIGAMFIFQTPMVHAAQFVAKNGGETLNTHDLFVLVRSLGDDIGVNGLVGDNRKEPAGDEKAMSKAAITSELDALQAAIWSVDAGNPDDVKRIVQHAEYIDEVAADHPAEMKANRVNVKKMIKEIEELTTAHPTLVGAKNRLVKYQK